MPDGLTKTRTRRQQMSPKKIILRDLSERVDPSGETGHVHPATISGFDQRPAEYQTAVNQLLKERLIDGQTDSEGKLTIGLNAHRVGDVRKILRPVWRRPSVWLTAVALLIAVAGLTV